MILLKRYRGKTTRNSWLGVRTPWTLGNDEVWSRTNRLAGRFLILGGVATILGALVGWGRIVLLCAVFATAAIAIVHSYMTAKRLRGNA